MLLLNTNMKILILTAEPSNFVPTELKKMAEGQGVDASICDITKSILVESSDKSFFVTSEGDWLDSENLKDTVIIPRLNEHFLETKVAMFRRLEELGATLLNSSSSMNSCNDKLLCQQMLIKLGLETPWSVSICDVAAIEPAVSLVEDYYKTFPVILKTLHGAQGIGVMKVDSKSSLTSVAQSIVTNGIQVLVQEFIEHEQSARIIMLGDELLAANLRKQPEEKDEFRTNSHLGSKTEKYEPSEAEIEIGRKIVQAFGCNFCAIDYIIKDDKFIILEVNGSPGLEAIQKDWEGTKNLANEVITFCKKMVQTEEPVAETDVTFDNGMISLDQSGETEGQPEAVDKPQEDFLQHVEQVSIPSLNLDKVEARVDTGAAYCSIHVDKIEPDENWISFTRGDVRYKVPVNRTIRLRNSHGKQERQLIKLDITIKGVRYNQVECSLSTRADMKYEMLVGRNLIGMINLPVKVDQVSQEDLPPSQVEIEEE